MYESSQIIPFTRKKNKNFTELSDEDLLRASIEKGEINNTILNIFCARYHETLSNIAKSKAYYNDVLAEDSLSMFWLKFLKKLHSDGAAFIDRMAENSIRAYLILMLNRSVISQKRRESKKVIANSVSLDHSPGDDQPQPQRDLTDEDGKIPLLWQNLEICIKKKIWSNAKKVNNLLLNVKYEVDKRRLQKKKKKYEKEAQFIENIFLFKVKENLNQTQLVKVLKKDRKTIKKREEELEGIIKYCIE